MGTSTFKRADTVAETGGTAGQQTIVEAAPSERPRGGAVKVVAGVAIVAALAGAGWYVLPALTGAGGATGRAGGGILPIAKTRGKVILPLSKLEGRVPKGVDGSIQMGISETYLTYRDVEVEPGEYVLIFKKKGYQPLIRKYSVGADGRVDPPLESIRFEFEPTEELNSLFARAERAFEQKQYREAIAHLRSIMDTAPDYPGAQALLDTCRKFLEEFQALFKRGQLLSRERRWKDAIDVLRRIPETAEEYPLAQSMIREAEFAIARLKQAQETFDRQLAEGLFADARGAVGQIRDLSPIDDLAADQAEARVREAERLWVEAQREFETRQYEQARERLEALLKLCPRHAQATRYLAEVREKLEAKLGAEQRLAAALDAGEKAFAAGDYARASAEADRALLVEPGSRLAADLKERAQAKMVEVEIAAEIARLDGYFREKKLFNLLERVDSSDRKAYEALQADLQAFFAAPIVVREAKHEGFKVAMDGPERATVETTWALVLEFPEVRGAQPPVGAEREVRIPQRIRLRKGSAGWVFVSFEQTGEKVIR